MTSYTTRNSNRHAPAVGGRTVAFQDFSFSPSPLEPEVVAASLDGGAAIRLTTNNRLERDIAVSPDGAAIEVFRRAGITPDRIVKAMP